MLSNKMLLIGAVLVGLWYSSQQSPSRPRINPALDPLGLIGTGRGL